MTFIGIFLVLVIEQMQAAPAAAVRRGLSAYIRAVVRQFNGGERQHGRVGWTIGVVLPAVMLWFVRFGLDALSPLLALIFDVAVLYFVMGFRQFSHYFTDIQLALREGEVIRARQLFHEWTGRDTLHLGPSAIACLTIETGILSSHRHVYAPLFWFVLLGPAGAVLYRLSHAMLEGGGITGESQETPDGFNDVAQRAFHVLDWLPVRLTALSFAVVGDFEDAIYCWRTQADAWPDSASGILLSSGAGALCVRLGQPLPETIGVEERPELGVGDEADVEHLQSATGLMWRALVLSLLLLVLLTLANWAG